MSFTKNLLLTSAAIFASAFTVRGQEIVFDINHGRTQHDQRIDFDRFLSSPGEGDSKHVLKVTGGPKDSLDNDAATDQQKVKKPALVQATPQKPKAEKQTATKDVLPKEQEETDESILSFNILYYIIQKYKLQDIVD